MKKEDATSKKVKIDRRKAENIKAKEAAKAAAIVRKAEQELRRSELKLMRAEDTTARGLETRCVTAPGSIIRPNAVRRPTEAVRAQAHSVTKRPRAAQAAMVNVEDGANMTEHLIGQVLEFADI
ncbi:hypothetical protein JG687_00017286 [Phytophthora cactorum]|uniref:Uncharacterized protein n=1 Tax=Phytophthora cactorum TaxID=29920 RepID=A0A8T1TTL5_9STRA|nr:hypothetical protein PC123_g18065 [Phytophthora cactorum]KAG6945444.1 hypothetical protein JG687_00017286 [Phytophthora cactorum]